jgi:uncharacterized protein YacL (UPF0231 family)
MIRCYRDSNGYCRVVSNGLHPLVGAYLEQDVQSDLAACDELIALIDDIVGGRRECWTGTGNAHTVIMKADGVSLINEYDDSLGIGHIPLDVFRKCIETWRECISVQHGR